MVAKTETKIKQAVKSKVVRDAPAPPPLSAALTTYPPQQKENTMMVDTIYTAEKVAYSSIVGQSIMLLNEAGACIAQLSVINCDNPQDIADQVVSALKAPDRHAYKVGVAFGKSLTPEKEQALKTLADLGQEYDND